MTRLTVSAYVDARTCFVNAGYCNDWRVITIGDSSLNEWAVVASDVLDGTRFNVEIRLNTSLTAYVAVDLAY